MTASTQPSTTRAGLMARSFLVTAALVWIAATDARLVIPLALALPFWIAIELEAIGLARRAAKSVRALSRASVPSLRPTLDSARASIASSIPPLSVSYH